MTPTNKIVNLETFSPFEVNPLFNTALKTWSTQCFTVVGEYPGYNDIRRYTRWQYRRAKHKWEETIVKAACASGLLQFKRAWFHFCWEEKNKRRDPDNIFAFAKFILDALQKGGYIENDGWGQVLGWNNSFKTGPSRCVTTRLLYE